MTRFVRSRRTTNIRDRHFDDLGISWWHFFFAIPAAALMVFFGKMTAENFHLLRKGNWSGELAKLSMKLFERAPAPVARDNMPIEDKLWMRDVSFEAQMRVNKDCPFQKISAMDDFEEIDEKFDIPAEMLSQPFVIEGLMESWPAMHSDKWQRYKLLKTYGKKSIAFKTQSGIVYGGGKTNMKFTSFSRVLKDMRSRGDDVDDCFVFDSSVLNSMPELIDDIVEPEIPTWVGMREGEMWHIFSLGASRTGLPFHSHGPTWLGLVHGLKRWYIYPPGTGPPDGHHNDTGIISSVNEWTANVLPTLRGLPQAPMDLPGELDAHRSRGYHPIEYTQYPGQILYLPAGWSHLSINIGESIAFGAQRSQSASEKAAQADSALLRSPRNAEALIQKALSTAHLAMNEDSRSKFSITGATLNGMVRIQATSSRGSSTSNNNNNSNDDYDSSIDFHNLVLQSEDTWLLLVLPMAPSEEGKEEVMKLSKIWNDVAGQLKGILSVGIVEGGALPDDTPERQDVVVLLSFGDRSEGITAREAVETAALYNPKAGMTIEEITAFALQRMAERPAAKEGSATTVGAKARRLYTEAEVYIRRLLEVFPSSPEGHSLLCEVLGHRGKREEQSSAVQHSIALYDALGQSKRISAAALASLYGQLAECYLGTDQPHKALPLLQRSLDTSPRFLEAYINMVAAHSMMEDNEGIESTLEAAEKAGLKRDHPEMRQVLRTKGRGRVGAKGKPPPGRRQMKQVDL